ncbi:hypothetical protein A2803_04545 [Candidatus Woesebacteria bacterium RIFCSPHIGHO2_01_FULL_44_21]|uniref:UDP-glucose/GDP-mannose dehydrogenase dimerisation domain-containing protein n=1 Tax=Candidatus Woesebacteria bacterium RIFCSPHIGHO2_01_FULL_44_21 TaxID=1802503 RepID=A0A1F7YWR4_9BACT|nr:MAG: hypothetical protein A2803_04545 [Candidatus Woesebacteria bacterium RIFCSPHIGHO2_01_FULL_44_21]OGM71341.1 MAG: hypothetical protein A2897_00910 [Candidatus Woesebacteria bacterium RIFCSPLOWO2_01_FULL_44_24b]
MSVAIVGYGYVGKALHSFFGDSVAAVYDPQYKKIPGYPQVKVTQNAVNKCDLVVICVPTLESKDGSCDTSIVEQSVKWLSTPLILIKSTVEPGTTLKLSKKYGKELVFSPEYIGEGKYFTPPWRYPHPEDMKMHTFQIFGGPRQVTKKVVDLFTRIMGPHVSYMQTDSTTAEIVKYMVNSWGAMKVTFANEWYDICEAHGVDYREARELWALDSRVEKMHTLVFPDKRGFSGKCFPKDISAIIASAKKRNYVPKLLETVKSVNGEFVRKSVR